MSMRKRKLEEGGLPPGRQRRLSGPWAPSTKPSSAQKLPRENLEDRDAALQMANERRQVGAGLSGERRATRGSSVQQQPAAKPTTRQPVGSKAAAGAGKPSGLGAAAVSAHQRKAAQVMGSKQAKAAQRQYLSEATLDDQTFHVGDSVYVVLDNELLEGLSDAEEEGCPCIVCEDTDTEQRIMLECDRCLAGCHLGCLDPPLDDVPEGEWLCSQCAAGHAVPQSHASTACQHFLQSKGLGMARIEEIWKEPNGELECTFRWYCLPEETHTSRQRHHLAREVFLTQQRDTDSMSVILRRTHVLTPQQFQCSATCSVLGEDVFVCEYLYDSTWQRFRRRTEFDSDSDADDNDDYDPMGGDLSDSDTDSEVLGSTVAEVAAEIAHAWEASACEEHTKRATHKMKAGGGINRQGHTLADQGFLAQVGALAVPMRARKQQSKRAGSLLAQARSVLALAAVPRTLPCRDTERAQIAEFVTDVLTEDAGKCLYVSGIPGTGKTATVLEVMRSLRHRSETQELPPFQFIEINALRLPSPQHAYSALYEALTGDRAGPQAAAAALEDMFSSSSRRNPTIVLVDELDLLINKTQAVLYNLFDWPGRKGSRLSIIGIANTMDLPERLHQRIGSRLAGRRVVFQPYNKQQLQTIINSRLEGVPAFKPNALEFASRKVANNSGDVRRCLELCRRAAEIAEEQLHTRRRQQDQQQQAGNGGQDADQGKDRQQREEAGMVDMPHVALAINEMFNTGHVRMLREACRLERLILAAIHMETSSSGRSDCLLLDAWERLRVLCLQNCEPHGYPFPSVVERTLELNAKRLIICDPGSARVRIKVALNVAANDLLMVLNADTELSWLEAAISRATHAEMEVAE